MCYYNGDIIYWCFGHFILHHLTSYPTILRKLWLEVNVRTMPGYYFLILYLSHVSLLTSGILPIIKRSREIFLIQTPREVAGLRQERRRWGGVGSASWWHWSLSGSERIIFCNCGGERRVGQRGEVMRQTNGILNWAQHEHWELLFWPLSSVQCLESLERQRTGV